MRTFFGRFRWNRVPSDHFERYYNGVVGGGSGYPTADEARRDLRQLELDRARVAMFH